MITLTNPYVTQLKYNLSRALEELESGDLRGVRIYIELSNFEHGRAKAWEDGRKRELERKNGGPES